MGEQRVFVWDLPTRLFHWLLAAAVTGAALWSTRSGAARQPETGLEAA